MPPSKTFHSMSDIEQAITDLFEITEELASLGIRVSAAIGELHDRITLLEDQTSKLEAAWEEKFDAAI